MKSKRINFCSFSLIWCVCMRLTTIHMKASQFQLKERHSRHSGKVDITFALCNLYFIQFSFLSLFFFWLFRKSAAQEIRFATCDTHINAIILLRLKHTYSFKPFQSPKEIVQTRIYTYKNVIKNKMIAKLLSRPNVTFFISFSAIHRHAYKIH